MWHTILRIKRWRSCASGHNYGMDLIPGPGTSTCHGCGQKIEKENLDNRCIKRKIWSSRRGTGSRVAVSCGVGRRPGSDPALLWLWRRLAATAPIQSPSLGTSVCCRCGPKKKKNLERYAPTYNNGNPWI